MCIYQPVRTSRMWCKINFLSRVDQVRIRSFPSLRMVAIPRLKGPICLFTRKNCWMHTFAKSIGAMWNSNSFVQDLNSCCRAHFLRRWLLNHKYLWQSLSRYFSGFPPTRVWYKAVLLLGPPTNQNSGTNGAKITRPRRYSPNGAPQAPSHQLSPASR